MRVHRAYKMPCIRVLCSDAACRPDIRLMFLPPPASRPYLSYKPRSSPNTSVSVSKTSLCLTGLGNLLADGVPAGLLEEHDIEALEVVDLSPLLHSFALLCPRRILPLGDGTLLLKVLLEDTSPYGAGELGDLQGSEGQVAIGEGMAGNAGSGAIDNCPVVVNHFRNDGDLAIVGAGLEEDNSSDLDETREIRVLLNAAFSNAIKCSIRPNSAPKMIMSRPDPPGACHPASP